MATPPLPDVPPGTVLWLSTSDWRYGGHPLVLRVEAVRDDLSRYYDNEWLWISGQRLAGDGTPMGRLDALVKVSALVRHASHLRRWQTRQSVDSDQVQTRAYPAVTPRPPGDVRSARPSDRWP